jgi:hypothetical protein
MQGDLFTVSEDLHCPSLGGWVIRWSWDDSSVRPHDEILVPGILLQPCRHFVSGGELRPVAGETLIQHCQSFAREPFQIEGICPYIYSLECCELGVCSVSVG